MSDDGRLLTREEILWLLGEQKRKIAMQRAEINRLQEYKADIENALAHALDERHDDNTLHCACVPLLRQEIERLRADRTFEKLQNTRWEILADEQGDQLATCRRLLREVVSQYEAKHELIRISNNVDADFVDIRLHRKWYEAAKQAEGGGDE